MSDMDDRDFNDVFGDGNGGGFGPDLSRLGFPGGLVAMMMGGGDRMITGDEVETHEGQKILVPEGMSYVQVMRILRRLHEDAEMETSFNRRFLYRPDDGGHATYQVLRQRYGSVINEAAKIPTFFGTMDGPAETREITVGYKQKMQIPWGRIGIPTLEGVEMVLCDRHPDPEYGEVFELHVTAAKKHKAEIEAIFDEVEKYLQEHSIYRGKAIVGTSRPEFLDLNIFDPSKIVFADNVERQFQAGVMSVLKYSDALRNEGVPLKQASLLYGPHGTGKTSAMQIIAQTAVENGWTAIFAKTGQDDLEDVLLTARLYMPAVVFVEDIDVEASTGEDNEVRELLEAFDGVTAKGGELVMVMTTNHIERIHRGMLRPGRFDFVIEVDKLDRGGIERLIKAVVNRDKLAGDVDYSIVAEAMMDFTPAFVRGSCDQAVTFAVARLEGRRNYTITTQDLVDAANALRPQLELQQQAGGGEKTPTIESRVKDAVRSAITGTKGQDPFGNTLLELVPSGNGHQS